MASIFSQHKFIIEPCLDFRSRPLNFQEEITPLNIKVLFGETRVNSLVKHTLSPYGDALTLWVVPSLTVKGQLSNIIDLTDIAEPKFGMLISVITFVSLFRESHCHLGKAVQYLVISDKIPCIWSYNGLHLDDGGGVASTIRYTCK